MTTRRTVLKTIAAALMCPTIQLRQSIPDERLLSAFCAGGGDYYSMLFSIGEPFGVDSLTYATDSKAMIRAEIANRCEVGEKRLPPVGKVWPEYWHHNGQWRPLEPGDIRPTIVDVDCVCPDCGGRRVSLGDNFPDFSDPVADAMIHRLGYDVDDNSIRDASCMTCRGLKYAGPNITEICGVLHQTFRLRRILALPNVQVTRSLANRHALLFRADGFEGISLGVVKE